VREPKDSDWVVQSIIALFLEMDTYNKEIQNLEKKSNKFHFSFAFVRGNARANGLKK
jgi:hypothetical protein